ncbi:MAG TPA: amidohydrolase, partial [Candidatus Cloacimonadota bacterium]|nr:amidohydrolase [Candidatus Cloacimonadota bacterium]
MSHLFHGGVIWGHPHAEALLTEGGRILHIGSQSDCERRAKQQPQVVNLQGRMLLPSFTDAHTHFVEYAKSRLLVNLLGCRSIAEIRSYLMEYKARLSWQAEWILGGGWNRNVLEEPQLLNRDLLDAIWPDTPVALFSRDYHAKLCNSKALSIIGIDENFPDPAGGSIERDYQGRPTGVLYETATEIVDQFTIQPPDSEIVKAIKATVQDIYKWGLTGFHSMEYQSSAELLRKAQSEGCLFRTCWHPQASDLDSLIQCGAHSYEGDERFKIGGIKLFGDGSLGSRTAAMFKPYTGDADNTGILRYSDEELYSTMKKAAEHGFAVTIHAIGDRCVSQVIETTLRLKQIPAFRGLFHRIEHVQSIRPSDIPRLKESGLFASLQPVHIANDIPGIEHYWPHIREEVYAFRSMQAAGIPMAFGSDVPIETMNPFLGIYSAISRRQNNDPRHPVWQASECLSPETAIDAYTRGSAMASRSEHIRGMLAENYLADLIVV